MRLPNHGQKIDWGNLPLDDQPTFDLLNQGRRWGYSSWNRAGCRISAKQLHLDTFEEIIAVGALYRPGPMDMIPSFINRKHGREPIDIEHPWMKDILAETYGMMVYQEQVMQIASKLADYTLGRRRCASPRDGEKRSWSNGAATREIPLGGVAKWIDEETSSRFRQDGEICLVWLQQVPCRGLWLSLLCHRLF